MRRPGLSVCIPVFTDSLLARYAIETVHDVADEVLVYRDGPQQDPYWPRFLSLLARWPKVRILEGQTHLGYMVKNALLREASRTLIHFLDTDELLNEHYLDRFAEAIRFTEKERCITVLPVRDFHGDTDHICEGDLQTFDTSHSLAYWTPQLRWDNQTPADKLEHIYGAKVFLFPTCTEVAGSESLENDFEYTESFEPLIIHLARIKENRLLSYRAVAYAYQREQPECSMEAYVLRRAGASPDAPREPIFEKLACDWLNSWGRGVPVPPEFGKRPALLEKLRDVIRCRWQDGYLIGRDDSGWHPSKH